MPRIEKDFLGERQIPDDVYYGVQTLRGKENFHITGMPVSREPNFVKAFGYVKKAAAMANRDLGVLDAKIAEAIIHVHDSRSDRDHRRGRDGSAARTADVLRRAHMFASPVCSCAGARSRSPRALGLSFPLQAR